MITKKYIGPLGEKLDKLYKKFKNGGVLYLNDVCNETGLSPLAAQTIMNLYISSRKDQA